jgi:membrane-bound metal-dependent hydrolase YbcI (DUF457 family)
MEAFMASPVGHALAGLAVAWGADLHPANRAAGSHARAGTALTLACVALAAVPDIDLLVTGLHRTVTHSLLSVLLVGLAAALVASRASRYHPGPSGQVVRVAIVCALAWASHIGVDWISADSSTPKGMQILWPFSDAWFISGWDIFPGTERRRLLSEPSLRQNLLALVTELVLMVPILLGLWLVREKTPAGLSSELACSDHTPE